MLELTFAWVKDILADRPATSHKGDNGKGLLLAGSEGFTGAALMSAAAALRAGVGTLKVLCPEAVKPALYALPEAMVCAFSGGWDTLEDGYFVPLARASTCLGIGPGMGKGPGVQATLKCALSFGLPTVVDADGLNALVMVGEKREILHSNVVLTPHPGEMARLCEKPVEKITADPMHFAQQYATKWGCTVLLKGSVSYIASPDGRVARNTAGNAGLAKGGSGDVLTGIILALLGQGLPAFEAACAGAFLLGTSADKAMALLKERMLMARDVIDAVQETLSCFTQELE